MGPSCWFLFATDFYEDEVDPGVRYSLNHRLVCHERRLFVCWLIRHNSSCEWHSNLFRSPELAVHSIVRATPGRITCLTGLASGYLLAHSEPNGARSNYKANVTTSFVILVAAVQHAQDAFPSPMWTPLRIPKHILVSLYMHRTHS